MTPAQREESMLLGRTARRILEEQERSGSEPTPAEETTHPDATVDEDVAGAQQMKVLAALAKPIEDETDSEDAPVKKKAPAKKRAPAKKKAPAKKNPSSAGGDE